MKNIILIIVIYCASFCFFNIKVNAEPMLEHNYYNPVLINNEGADGACTGLLGANLKRDLAAVLKAIRIIAPLVVIFLTSAEMIGAVVSKDKEALSKSMNKLVTRIVLVAFLFFLPIILNLLLSFLDEKYTVCVK